MVAPVIRDGFSYLYSHKGPSDRHLTGWQAMVRVRTEGSELKDGPHREAYAVIHRFRGEVPAELVIPLPEGCPG